MESLEQTVIQLRQKKKAAIQAKQNAENELRLLQSIEKRSSTGLHNVDKKIESGEKASIKLEKKSSFKFLRYTLLRQL